MRNLSCFFIFSSFRMFSLQGSDNAEEIGTLTLIGYTLQCVRVLKHHKASHKCARLLWVLKNKKCRVGAVFLKRVNIGCLIFRVGVPDSSSGCAASNLVSY